MNISWRVRRQILIFLIYALIIILPVFFIVYILIAKNNSCFDTKMNGDETGIDCGGSCSLRCDGTYKDVKVNFSKILKVDENKYDIFTLLDNYNYNVAFPKIPYNLNLYNQEGNLLISASGTVAISSQAQAVVYIPNVNLNQIPKTVDFQLGKHFGILDTVKPNTNVNVNTWNAQTAANDGLQIIGEVTNSGDKSVENLSIYALLYDDTRSVYAVGKTKLRLLKGRERTAIAYTWGKLFKPTNTQFIIVYDE
jgi:hypothetical protein